MGNFTFNHSSQQDDLYKSMSAAEIKAAFDSRGNELKDVVNNLIDALKSTVSGDSGAKNIGATSIPGLSGNDVQSLIESLKTLVDEKANSDDVYTKLALLSTAAGNSGADLINTSPLEGVPGTTIRQVLQELKYQINAAVTGTIPNGSIGPEKLSFDPATQQELNAAIAGLQMVDTNIDVVDVNNHFTSTKLNGVLDELFTSANSVKTNVSNAIGSPATSNDTGATLAGYINTEKGRIASTVGDGTGTSALQYLVDRLLQRRTDIATAVNSKGVSASSADTLAQLATKISQIATGKKWASGTLTSGTTQVSYTSWTAGVRNFYQIAVSGLAFTPSVIIFSRADGSSSDDLGFYFPNFDFRGNAGYDIYTLAFLGVQTPAGAITSNGFTMPVGYSSTSYKWIAFE